MKKYLCLLYFSVISSLFAFECEDERCQKREFYPYSIEEQKGELDADVSWPSRREDPFLDELRGG